METRQSPGERYNQAGPDPEGPGLPGRPTTVSIYAPDCPEGQDGAQGTMAVWGGLVSVETCGLGLTARRDQEAEECILGGATSGRA